MGSKEANIAIGAIDVGAPKNIGWAIILGEQSWTSSNLDEFVEQFASVAQGRSAALGFEAPLFIPMNDELNKLTSQRDGEKGRPWSAGAGATVTTIGLAIMCYTLTELRTRMPDEFVTLDWKAWPDQSSHSMLVYEAFVSGANHAAPGEHWRDALSAAHGFRNALHDLESANAVTSENCLSLVGTCLARTGWIEPSTELLSHPCLVIRPENIAAE